VQEALEVASRSRTTVCIAHRLSTIKNADSIIVMSNGRVVEQGSHDELYANDGMYRGLVDAQRISAESTGDGGAETPEEVVEMENVLRRSRSQSIPQGDIPPLFRRKSSRRSESFVEVQDLESGVVQKTKYSLWYLLKKVLVFDIVSDCRLSPSIRRNMVSWLLDGLRLQLQA